VIKVDLLFAHTRLAAALIVEAREEEPTPESPSFAIVGSGPRITSWLTAYEHRDRSRVAKVAPSRGDPTSVV